MNALELQDIHYAYKSDWGGKKTPALSDISLAVSEGEVFGFLGRSGAGKTTTIKCILNFVQITSGTISIFGKPHTDPCSREQLGYVPEQPYFYDHLSVYEILEMYASLSGRPKSSIRQDITQALQAVHIEEKERSPMRTLSKGQTQRIAMAQAIIAKPKLLILDEPFSGLDPLGRKQFKDLLFQLKKEGTTIFISSHILEDIQNLCDRVSIMSNGQVKKILSLDELSSHSQTKFEIILSTEPKDSLGGHKEDLPGGRTSLSFSNEADARQALQKAIESDYKIERYEHHKGTLEELFVEVTGEA